MMYAHTLRVIMLWFGITHTIVLDADKMFCNTFRQMWKLLDLNVHTISGRNDDPMLVKRVNNYLNKGLKIITLE